MIPAHSTTILIESNDTFDPDEEAEWTAVATGIRAHIEAAAAPSTISGQVVTAELTADLCDLHIGHRVTNLLTGERYVAVTALRSVTTVGSDHVRAMLSAVSC